MLWTKENIEVINRATEEDKNGKYITKDNISSSDREVLESLNELSMIEYGEDIILNL